MTETDPARWIDVLAGSHDKICDLVGELDADGLRRRSYCPEWTIAQVLSHLGSSAELCRLTLDAGVAGEPTPSREAMQPVWERWNALQPEEQAEGFLSTDGQLVETLENLGDQLDNLTFTFFGLLQTDAIGLLGMRLSEHAVHTWDVAVALDPAATVDADAVSLLVDRLPQVADRSGTSIDARSGLTATVVTSDPHRRFTLTVHDGVHLESAEGEGAGEGKGAGKGAREGNEGAGGMGEGAGGMGEGAAVIELPAEAFLRLVYGRLDAAHTPPLAAASAKAIETLRAVFRGF